MIRPSMDELKMAWGFLLLLIAGGLIARIALGTVQEETSFGLTQMIGVLGVLAGGWATWAFSSKGPPKDDSR